MAEFLSNLDVELVDDCLWRLTAPLAYQSDIAGRIIVPDGFTTDFASVPRIPVVYLSWGDRAHREAVLHDYLYCSDCPVVVDRAAADSVFLEAILHRLSLKYLKPDQSWLKKMAQKAKINAIAYPMYWGVRAGGWRFWHSRSVRSTDYQSG